MVNEYNTHTHKPLCTREWCSQGSWDTCLQPQPLPPGRSAHPASFWRAAAATVGLTALHLRCCWCKHYIIELFLLVGGGLPRVITASLDHLIATGWAPEWFFTGPWWNSILLALIFAIFWFYFIWHCCLLDNEPLQQLHLWNFRRLDSDHSSVIAFFGFLWCFHRIYQVSGHRTPSQLFTGTRATRSQVRAQGHWSISRLGTICIITAILTSQSFDPVRGEGSVMDMRDGRAGVKAPAKPHVVEPRKVLEPYQTLTSNNFRKNSVQKRSYRRALQRISRHGFTWYRGQLLSGPRTTEQPLETNPKSVSSNHAPSRSLRNRRLSIFSWNCGELTMASWDHLQQWLTLQQLDIILLQETHWQFSSEWMQSHFYCLHSGAGPRQAGLLTMISKRLVQQNDISWSEPIPGRVLHARIHGSHKGCDIINVYQHVHNIQRLDERADVWHCLHNLISTLPKRNSLFVAGDLNTSLHKRCMAVGLPTYAKDNSRHWGPAHRDADQLYNLLQVYNWLLSTPGTPISALHLPLVPTLPGLISFSQRGI